MKEASSDPRRYRADIDGLRAIAVLSVVIFHAWPNALPGGFVGVDIFFVISGYLISTIIFNDIERCNFSLKAFYSRRIKRIFPALIVVLAASLILGWLALMADEYRLLGKHAASTALFISNFVLLNESGYFDASATFKPLLHLWSLGIEVQFYIAWPIVIYAAARLRINLLTATIFLAFLSFALNVARIDDHLVQTFYQPFTRFWELLLGGILAHVTMYSKSSYKLRDMRLANLSAIAGLALVVAALFLLNEDSLFPGWWAVLPTIGSALLIAAGTDAWINKNILAFRPAVIIGVISYPIYLWHWPLLSFLNIAELSEPPAFLVLFTVLLSLLLAWLTYEVVEKRFRHHPSPWVAIGLVVAVAAMGLIGIVIYGKDGFPNRPSLLAIKKFETQMSREAATDATCLEYAGQSEKQILFDYCRASHLNFKRWIAVIGDSHAHAVFPGFSGEFHHNDFGSILLANSSCPPFKGTVTGRSAAEMELCSQKIDQILRVLDQENRIEKVLIATRGPVYMTGSGFGPAEKAKKDLNIKSVHNQEKSASYPQIFLSGLNATIAHITSSGKKVSYMLENPELGVLPRNCIGRPLTFNSERRECNVDFSIYKARMSIYRPGVFEMRNSFPDLLILDPEPLFCDRQICRSILNDKLLYADDNHFSIEGSRYVGTSLAPQLFVE